MFNILNLFHKNRPENKYLTIPLRKVEKKDYQALLKELAGEIEQLRRGYGLSHEAIAKLSEMSVKNIISMEKNGYLGEMKLHHLIRYLAVFNCKIRLEIVSRH